MITASINARIHDKAKVASISFSISMGETDKGGIGLLTERLSEQLSITNKWADEQGALIGHVKAYIKWDADQAVMLSTTGAEVDAKGSEIPAQTPDKAEMGITAIVFGVELKSVKDRLIGIAGAIAGQYGEYCIYSSEHDHKHDTDISDNSNKVKRVKIKKTVHKHENN